MRSSCRMHPRFGTADLLLKLDPPTIEEASMIREGNLDQLCLLARNEDLLKALGEKKINFLGMDCVPRISRLNPWTH